MILFLPILAASTVLFLLLVFKPQGQRPCPRCGATMVPVLYRGAPGHYCGGEGRFVEKNSSQPECSMLTGPAALVVRHLGYNGRLFVYSGCYAKGLLQVLRTRREQNR